MEIQPLGLWKSLFFLGKFPNSCIAESLTRTDLEYFRNRVRGRFFG